MAAGDRAPGRPSHSTSVPGRAPTPDELEALYRRHHRPENLYPDPLVFARGYADPLDGEVAGLVAAALAYGRVERIMEALEQVFAHLGAEPRRAVLSVGPGEWLERLGGFAYRFHKGLDVAVLLLLLRRTLERWGSLAALFHARDPGGDIREALAGLAGEILAADPRPLLQTRAVPRGHPVRHLVAGPGRGGAAKRLCLFLRWMVRRDALDPGYWHGRIDPARLVVPLDTHVAQVGRDLGFTRRRSADWRTAREITEALRAYDPADPVRFDFSLFRFGMGRGGAPRGPGQ